jgi:hypothetical protein
VLLQIVAETIDCIIGHIDMFDWYMLFDTQLAESIKYISVFALYEVFVERVSGCL